MFSCADKISIASRLKFWEILSRGIGSFRYFIYAPNRSAANNLEGFATRFRSGLLGVVWKTNIPFTLSVADRTNWWQDSENRWTVPWLRVEAVHSTMVGTSRPPSRPARRGVLDRSTDAGAASDAWQGHMFIIWSDRVEIRPRNTSTLRSKLDRSS